MTKQEEFLDILKDPNKAKLNDAAKEFQYDFPSIHDIQVFKSPITNTYSIIMYADNHGTLFVTKKIFENIIIKHLGKNTWIGSGFNIEQHNSLFCQTYIISFHKDKQQKA